MVPAIATLLTGYKSLPKPIKKQIKKALKNEMKGGPDKEPLTDLIFDKVRRDLKPIDDKEVAERMKSYRAPHVRLMDATDALTDVAGDVITGYTGIKGLKHSLLGDAMLALRSDLKDQNKDYATPGMFMNSLAAGQKLKGAAIQQMGQTASDVLHDFFDPFIARGEKNLSTEQDIREQPNTGFYNLTNARERRQQQGRQKGRDRQR